MNGRYGCKQTVRNLGPKNLSGKVRTRLKLLPLNPKLVPLMVWVRGRVLNLVKALGKAPPQKAPQKNKGFQPVRLHPKGWPVGAAMTSEKLRSALETGQGASFLEFTTLAQTHNITKAYALARPSYASSARWCQTQTPSHQVSGIVGIR